MAEELKKNTFSFIRRKKKCHFNKTEARQCGNVKIDTSCPQRANSTRSCGEAENCGPGGRKENVIACSELKPCQDGVKVTQDREVGEGAALGPLGDRGPARPPGMGFPHPIADCVWGLVLKVHPPGRGASGEYTRTRCVTVGMSHTLSGPRFPHLPNTEAI